MHLSLSMAELLSFFMTLLHLTKCTEGDTPLQQFVNWKAKQNLDYGLVPAETKGQPLVVNLSVYINNMIDLKEAEMEYTVDVYLRQQWKDHRLAFNENVTSDVESVALPDVYYKDIWLPDTFIVNGKREERHIVTQENRGFRVYRDGRIFYSQRLTLKLWCNVQLQRFPHDIQECELKFMTYRYQKDQMVIKWLPSPIEALVFREGVENQLLVFSMVNISLDDCTESFVNAGAFSCVGAHFVLRRQVSYYIMQVYMPSCLLVCISFMSFWLDPGSAPARVLIGVMTILTMSNQMTNLGPTTLPKVNYIKAIDIWVVGCMIFLFATMMEFALVHTMSNRPKDVMTTQQTRKSIKGYTLTRSTEYLHGTATSRAGLPTHRTRIPYITSVKIDVISRAMFPAMFAVFVMTYGFLFML